MNIVLPPLFFYAVGALLVVFGALRIVVLGRRNPNRELSDDNPARARIRKRHVAFGVVWIVMGLFLVASTAGVLRMRH
jgi:hypothetical protein